MQPEKELSVLLDVGLAEQLLGDAGARMTWCVWTVMLRMARCQREAGAGRWFLFPTREFLSVTGMDKSSYMRARKTMFEAGLIASMPQSRRVVMRPNLLWMKQGARSKWLELLMQAFDLKLGERERAMARLKARFAMVPEERPMRPEKFAIQFGGRVRKGRS